VRARTLVARPPVEGPFPRQIGAIFRRTRELPAAGRVFLDLLIGELGVGATRPGR
jgi:DNA-binding transcriptional LysR family regulator